MEKSHGNPLGTYSLQNKTRCATHSSTINLTDWPTGTPSSDSGQSHRFFKSEKPSGFLESGHSNPGTCLRPSVDISVRKLDIMALVKAEERAAYLDLDNAVEVESKLTRALEAVQAHSDRLIAKKESGEMLNIMNSC